MPQCYTAISFLLSELDLVLDKLDLENLSFVNGSTDGKMELEMDGDDVAGPSDKARRIASKRRIVLNDALATGPRQDAVDVIDIN